MVQLHSQEVKDSDGSSGTLLEERGIWLFTGEVDDANASDVVRWILEENLDDTHEDLTLIINSPGGDVTAGFAVIDAMCGSHIPIRTVGMGQLASMGLLMFITGQKGNRILTPNTLIMSHQWEGGLFGKEHELIAGIKRNALISDMVIRHYKRYTGLSMSKINKYLLPPSDVYLTASEAKQLGLCDDIRVV